MPCPSHSSWLGHPKNIVWGVEILKHLNMCFSPFPCYLIPLRPKYSPQHPFLKENIWAEEGLIVWYDLSKERGTWDSAIRFKYTRKSQKHKQTGKTYHVFTMCKDQNDCSKTNICVPCIEYDKTFLKFAYCRRRIQGVPGGKDLTSGECSLGQTIPI